MRLTNVGNRLALLAALIGAVPPGAGCRSGPYIDQSKAVPHDPVGRVADEDREVKQAALFSASSCSSWPADQPQ